ncbi:MAG TPA: Spy/CpxP family protein refolding chaperone [Candidatus Binataceae bacterium]|nr:Spy/CpxP family protein refolding chaperone [Candidatus Binataceae bacterium]
MFLITNSAVRAVAAATLLGAFVLPSPARAVSGDLAQAVAVQSSSAREVLAQAAPSEATAAPAPEESAATEAKANAAVDTKVEAHIKALRGKLHITSAQETQWNALAQVMRDNAHAMANLREEATEQAKSMSAVDHLKAYAAITDAQAAGVHKFLPAFEALYDTMSDAQKKTADALFRSHSLASAKKPKQG